MRGQEVSKDVIGCLMVRKSARRGLLSLMGGCAIRLAVLYSRLGKEGRSSEFQEEAELSV